MPIYEFYCCRCNRIFNFFSRRIDTETAPLCPRCKKINLERLMSIFSTISTGKKDENADSGMPPIDEEKMGRAMAMMAQEADKIDEDDPRQAVSMMRKLSEAAGLNLSNGMEEALSRIERGEDPEKIEEEMGDMFDNENPFAPDSSAKGGSRRARPAVDETLYDLQEWADGSLRSQTQ
ncbi:MAG: zinc ribbon domain-containing protein [Deltaproteobacteria bacterium]|nr:zinc ribbon domain-containing protein [Deltaproteobacteria bacterium]